MGVFAIRGRGLAVPVAIAPHDNVISQPLRRNTPQIISGGGSCFRVWREVYARERGLVGKEGVGYRNCRKALL